MTLRLASMPSAVERPARKSTASTVHVARPRRARSTASSTSPMRSVPTTFSHDSGVDLELVVGRRTGTPSGRRSAPAWPRAPAAIAHRVGDDLGVDAVAEPRARHRSARGRRDRRGRADGSTRRSASRACRGRSPRPQWVTRSRSNCGDELVGVHDLVAVVGGRPAEQREVVDERFGQVAGVDGSPRARPRRGASTAWPATRRRRCSGRCAYCGSARSSAERVRAARAPGGWSRGGPRPGSRG